MDNILKFIDKLLQRESKLFVFAAFIYLAYRYRPDILVPIRNSLKPAIPTVHVSTWIEIAVNIVSLWNLFAVAIAVLLFLWGILIGLIPKLRENAELNWIFSVKVCLGWIVRSSLWWWNLVAVQILLSMPVSIDIDLHSFLGQLRFCSLVVSCPLLMSHKLVAWVLGTHD